MKSEGNFFDFTNSSKSNFKRDIITHKNLSLSENNNYNDIQQDSYYLGLNSSENDNKKCSVIKDELEFDHDINIHKFLTKDIIDSINEINSEPHNNLSKDESIKEISVRDETESYEDENDSSQNNSEDEDDNINDNDLKIEKEIKNEFPFNFEANKSSDFLIKNNLTFSTNKSEHINNTNRYLSNNINIDKENKKINCWDSNTRECKIFNLDNQENQQNNNVSYKLNIKNIHVEIDGNNLENNPIIENKEITNLNSIFQKNKDRKINKEEFFQNKEFFDNNFINQKFNTIDNQNGYINFDNKNNNKQIQNNHNNYFVPKDLNITYFNKIDKNDAKENIKDNELNIYNVNLNDESSEKNQKDSDVLDNDNNSSLYKNNKFINYNNYINLIYPIHQNNNINFDSQEMKNNINLNPNNYLITMFGKIGWICRLCDNFNFETRTICNRCKAIKAPKSKEEIRENEEIEKLIKRNKKAKKSDWFCPNCQNINYYFRKNCNRCKIERKKEFPSFFLEHNQRSKGNNNNMILAKNINSIRNCLNKNIINNINFSKKYK